MKFLITTIVGGNLYQNFTPIYIYSVKKAYPNCSVKIYSWDRILTNVKNILKDINCEDNLIYKDFGNISKCTQNIKAMRWLYQYEDIKDFDVVFTGDIDFFIVEENPSLLDQHLNFCETQNLPYSNRVRAKSHRLTGLHFYKIEEYYNACSNVIDEFRERLCKGDNRIFRHPKSNLDIYDGDEEMLYQIIEKSGLGFPKNVTNKRKHHGIHLKRKYNPNLAAKETELTEYTNNFVNAYENDEIFKEILAKISSEAKTYIDTCYRKLK